MGKIHYLNNHLDKYREDRIKFELEDIEGISHYRNIGNCDPKIIKLFIKCFKNKENFKEFLFKLPKKLDNLDKYSLITRYWFAFIIYYQNSDYDELIGDCLEAIDENVVLLNSPHFCKKVYYYLNSPKPVFRR